MSILSVELQHKKALDVQIANATMLCFPTRLIMSYARKAMYMGGLQYLRGQMGRNQKVRYNRSIGIEPVVTLPWNKRVVVTSIGLVTCESNTSIRCLKTFISSGEKVCIRCRIK